MLEFLRSKKVGELFRLTTRARCNLEIDSSYIVAIKLNEGQYTLDSNNPLPANILYFMCVCLYFVVFTEKHKLIRNIITLTTKWDVS